MVDLSLLQDFITEALEHLEELESSLLKLEQDPNNKETLDDIFRNIHTIKGASQFVGIENISELSHKLENLLDLLRGGEKELNQDIIDTLIDTKDRIGQLTGELEQTQEEKTEIDDLLDRINTLTQLHKSDEETAPKTVNEPEKHVVGDLEETLESALDTSILDDELHDETLLESLSQQFDSEQENNDLFAVTEQEEVTEEVSAPVAAELIADEISGESYDEELFSIFLQQTKSNYENIIGTINKEPSSENQDDLLADCHACLLNMKSSANYMGYSNLTNFFEKWLTELEEAQSEGQRSSLHFMTDYATQLAGAIPQIMEQESKTIGGDDEPESSDELAQSSEDMSSKASIELHDIDEELIKEEVSGEDYDNELFIIFIKQVRDNLGILRNYVDDFESAASKADTLADCKIVIDNLIQSANYMDYVHLLRFYENWRTEIEAACKQVEEGQEIEADFMDSYLDKIFGFLPQVEESLPEVDISEEVSDTANLEDEEDAQVAIESGSETNEEESKLFAALSDSVDSALNDKKETKSSFLHPILEELLREDDSEEALAEIQATETETIAQPEADEESPEIRLDQNSASTPEKTTISEPEHVEAELDQQGEDKPDRRKHERRLNERRSQEGAPVVKQTVRVDSNKIDALMNQVGELVVSRAYFTQILTDLRSLQQELKQMGGDQRGQKPIREISFKLAEATVSLGRISNELQEGVMKVRMLPVSQLFNRYPRLVRDLIRKTDKKVDLVIKGEETELDKMVIEQISDPLIHVIRNAVDHGIETAQERKKAGKPPTSTLTLEAYHESNHIVIEITDDGRGIDPERIKEKALERGLISEQEILRMSDAEARRFIMMPGFSTAKKTTETSGRGVGMDVIKTNVEKLNGTVEIDSELGVQTQIRIKIPLTLAIIQALLIRVGTELYTIPLSVVEETLRIYEHETSIIEGVEVIHLRDTTMPIFKLSELFGIKSEKQDISKSFVVIVTTGMQRIGLVVDQLMGQEEVVIKPLVDYLREDSGFSGATIIGDGRISLILDIYELVKITSKRQADRYKSFAERNKLLKNNYQNAIGLENVPTH